MTQSKILTVVSLSAVLAGSVSSLAQAEGKESGSPRLMLNFEMMDGDKDGKVTSAEFEAFKAAEFAKADTNGDRQVSANELAAKHVADVTLRAATMAEKMIARMDENADGQLSAEELAQEQRPPTLFERADSNGDGAVSKAEADDMQGKMKGHFGKHHRNG